MKEPRIEGKDKTTMRNSVLTFSKMKEEGKKISMLTCYDYSTAKLMDGNIDAILVGDSLGNTMLGLGDTIPVTVDDMITYGASVVRGTQTTMIVVDMPFMSYQASMEQALLNAGRIMKETHCQAIKLEGGARVCPLIRAMVDAGIPVMAHIGLTPQSINAFGGCRVQGKTEDAARELLEDAYAVQEAGAFSVVLECVPAPVAALITSKLDIPTIGIGGGDTEHGGIYYSLFHKTNEHLKALQLRGKPYGMMPVPYAQATVLRKNADGTYHECNYNEYGIIVANSATTMAGYKDFEKVRSKVLTDEQGMDWLSCDVYGFIDKLGCIHMKDRRDSAVEMEDGSTFLPFRLADEAQKDSANIMTSVITTEKYEGRLHFIVNYELSPIRKTEDEMKVLQKLDSRIRQAFPEICDRILYRQFDSAHPFPVNPSGKRNMVGVQNMGVEGAFRLNPQHEMVPVILS